MSTKRKRSQYATQRPSKKQRLNQPKVQTQGLIYRKVRPEYKVTDVSLSTTGVTSAGYLDNLTTNLTRGATSYNNFQGNTIDIVSLKFRFNIVAGESNALIPIGPDTNNMTRLVLFQWLGDSDPLLQDVLQFTGIQGPLSPWVSQNTDKLNILADRTYSTYLTCFQTTGLGTTVSGNVINDKIYIKGNKMLPVTFKNTGVATANNDIHVLVIADSALAPHPTMSFTARLTFID